MYAMLFDTHVHFDGLIDGDGALAVIARAQAAGVERMIAVGGSTAANRLALEVARSAPRQVTAAIGYDRGQTAGHCPMDEIEILLAGNKIAAVGETGLDYHHLPADGHGDRRAREAQLALFQSMLALARRFALPAIVHSRAAEDDTLSVLAKHAAAWRGRPDGIGVLHCFTGDAAFAQKLLELGFAISFSGIVTFAETNGNDIRELHAAAALVPNDRLLIETDAPHLAPEPYRGRRNEPAYVRRVAEVLAQIRGTSFETIAELTTRNAERLFRHEN